MKYTFKNHLFTKAGTQLGLRYKAFDEFTNSVNDDDDLKYKLKIKDQFHPIDAGLAFGAGYRLMKGNGMNIGSAILLWDLLILRLTIHHQTSLTGFFI